ncbi:MAG: 30S ribosomal protein S8 [Acidiferrobacterales bacterium]
MMMTDPIADMFTRIRNAQRAEKVNVRMPASRTKMAIAKLLSDEGFVGAVSEVPNDGKPLLEVELKYYEDKPVIVEIKRVSKPGRREYKGSTDLPKVVGGIGIAIISTSKGIMSDRAAREAGVGGEIIGYVS